MAMQLTPEEVYSFRMKLQQLADDLNDQLRRTDAAMDAVAQEWKDAQFKKYHEQFIEDRDLIAPLRDEITEFQEGPLQQIQINAQEYLDL